MKEYLAKEKEEVRLKRAARTAGDFYVAAEPKVYFVVRIRGCVLFFFEIYLSVANNVIMQYQRDCAQAPQNFTASPFTTNQQWCVC